MAPNLMIGLPTYIEYNYTVNLIKNNAASEMSDVDYLTTF